MKEDVNVCAQLTMSTRSPEPSMIKILFTYEVGLSYIGTYALSYVLVCI